MTHDSAVKIMTGLLPLIEKSGAEKVLTEYATTEDLPPAQLEKLAQVYNTMAVISHVDNSSADTRGDSIPLLNVPNLVVGYATGLGREKAAQAPSSTSTHDPLLVDFNAAIMKELSPPREVVKAASSPQPAVLELSDDVLESAIIDNLCDLREQMSKLAGDIVRAAPRTDEGGCALEDLEKEALYLVTADSVKVAGDFLEKFAKAHRLQVTRFQLSTPLTKRAFAVTPTGLVGKFVDLAKCAGLHTFFEKLAAGDASSIDALLRAAAGQEIPAGPDGDTTAAAADALAAAMDRARQRVVSADGTTPNKDAPLPTEKVKNTTGGGGGGGGVDKEKAQEKGKGNGWIGSALTAPLRWTSRGIIAAHDKGRAALAAATAERSNSAQQKTDMSVEDIRRSVNLRRMIGTDPVLREADPKAVLDIYNSVTAMNPEIAGNMPALRLLLREAVSYEGLTLDAGKTLLDMYKTRGDAEGKDAENTKRRYSIGKPVLAPKS